MTILGKERQEEWEVLYEGATGLVELYEDDPESKGMNAVVKGFVQFVEELFAAIDDGAPIVWHFSVDEVAQGAAGSGVNTEVTQPARLPDTCGIATNPNEAHGDYFGGWQLVWPSTGRVPSGQGSVGRIGSQPPAPSELKLVAHAVTPTG